MVDPAMVAANGEPKMATTGGKRGIPFASVETDDASVSFYFPHNGHRQTVTLGDLESWGLLNHAALHGVEQKLRDAYALNSGATAAEKFAAFSTVMDRLNVGLWNVDRAGAGGSSIERSARAAVRSLYGADAEAALAFGATPAFWAAVAADPEVAAEIQRRRALAVRPDAAEQAAAALASLKR